MNDRAPHAGPATSVPGGSLHCEHCGLPVTSGRVHVERNARSEIFFMGHKRCSAWARRLLHSLTLNGAPSFRSMASARACLEERGVKLDELFRTQQPTHHQGVQA